MKNKKALNWTPAFAWTGVAILLGVCIAYTPALGNGSTWTLPYSGSANSVSNLIDVTNSGGGYAIAAHSTAANGIGMTGSSTATSGTGVTGSAWASNGTGMIGYGGNTGVFGYTNGSNASSGIWGYAATTTGTAYGCYAASYSPDAYGVYGAGFNDGIGTCGYTDLGFGVFGHAASGTGVVGNGSIGVYGVSNGTGSNLAGYFAGNVTVYGNLQVNGTINKSAVGFKIDHPTDPAHKYLMHSCIESDEMMNLYRGSIMTDSDGKATVTLPDWFQAENRDFNYQLTAVGASAPDLHIGKEIEKNQFEIEGGRPGMKVCWVVTGVRNDAYARAHPLKVEVEKPAQEQGRYIRPEEFGQPQTKNVNYDAGLTQKLKQAEAAVPSAHLPTSVTPQANRGAAPK